VKLRKALADKVVSLKPFVNELEEGLNGHASPADVELLFQMMHLWFTGPRRDESAFDVWRARETENVRNRRLSPEGSFFEDMTLFASQNHLRRQPVTPEVVKKIDLDKAMSIYRDRFADADDFTFVFVGNIDLERLRPLVTTYLGSLPTGGRKETWRDVKVRFPPGVKTKTVVKGTEPKSMVLLLFHGDERWSRDTENDIRSLSEALNIRFREILREDMGGVYGVSVFGQITRRPRQEFVFGVFFGCAPDNVDKLEKAIFDEAKAIQSNGIGEEYIAKLKELRRRAHEVELKDNAYWERELVRAYTYNDDPRLIPDISPLIDKITSARIQAAARKYVASKQYVLGVLEPERVKGAK
jgi:zinc protease